MCNNLERLYKYDDMRNINMSNEPFLIWFKTFMKYDVDVCWYHFQCVLAIIFTITNICNNNESSHL